MKASFFQSSIRRYLVVLATTLVVTMPVFALPGNAPPDGLLSKLETSGRLRDGQETELVYLNGVQVSDLQRFGSNKGRTHLTFTITIGDTTYPGIMYDGEWVEVDESRLNTGTVALIGLWDEYDGAPSFTTKWVENPEDAQVAETRAEGKVKDREDLVLLERTKVSEVSKFVSSSLKMHVRFLLQAQGDDRIFQGVAYEGDWNADTLAALRYGSANLVGYWDEFQGEPSFVLQGLE